MSGTWSDLRTRAVSAVVMLAVGALAIWAGGVVFAALVVAAVAAMLWEAWRMTLAQGRDGQILAAYAAVILLAGWALIAMRSGESGLIRLLWLVAVVVVSDVMGYFAGRLLGGPKFWPRVSPKKTWSGTVAGWLGAALVGAGFMSALGQGWALVPVSALVSFAGQMGDIAESAIKRRAGVKDSSALIPGHGGVLDRFDALIFAAVLAAALGFGG